MGSFVCYTSETIQHIYKRCGAATKIKSNHELICTQTMWTITWFVLQFGDWNIQHRFLGPMLVCGKSDISNVYSSSKKIPLTYSACNSKSWVHKVCQEIHHIMLIYHIITTPITASTSYLHFTVLLCLSLSALLLNIPNFSVVRITGFVQ